VIPPGLVRVVDELPYWFVIGGHAVRCFCPYRPSRDVDFGVRAPRDLTELLAQLGHSGEVEVVERGQGTVHLRWTPGGRRAKQRRAPKGASARERKRVPIDVSIFVLDRIAEFVEGRRLTVTGILATKLHAILDRGTRRDFFDLYVTLQHHRLGIAECLDALQKVYRQPVNQGLLLRALTYFDDAEREARLPGEGPRDFRTVKEFFNRRVGDLLVPPSRKLAIQSRRVDVVDD
jgi:hypothetical protein